MSFNGAGIFNVDSNGFPAVYDTVAEEDVFNNIIDELGDGLSNTICRDGQSVISQNIPFNAKRITNLGAAASLKDAISGVSTINHYFNYATSRSGTANAITLGTRAITDFTLSEGFGIWFIPTADNTGAATVNVNSTGVKDITKCGTVALSAGDIRTGAMTFLVYDGTRFQITTPYYAEGSWTPSIGGTATYTTQIGRWKKIGGAVHVMCSLVINSIGSGSTSVISGLPYTSSSLANQALAVSDFASLATSVVWIGARVDSNATTITLRNLTAAGASATSSALFGNSAAVTITGTYFI